MNNKISINNLSSRKQPINIQIEKTQKEQADLKEFDDYVLVFNKPHKESVPSNTIPIPQSILFLNSINR